MADALPNSSLATIFQSYFEGLSNVYIGLNKNPSPPNPSTMVWGDIIEPEGSWYDRVTATVNSAYINDAGQVEVDVVPHQWEYSGTFTSETIYGWFVATDTASVVTLITQGVFPTPQIMAQNLNAVTAVPSVVVPPIALS